MKILLFVAADCANTTDDNKLNIMGIFSTLLSYKFPARHPTMYIAIKLTPDVGEPRIDRQVTVLLHDPDGKEIISVSGPLQFPQLNSGKKPETQIILHLNDITFPQPGPYQFILLVDKEYKGELTIYVDQIIPPPELLDQPQ